MKKIYQNLFTSESVGKGHPDKICDQISDAILDKALEQDENSRTAIETMITKKFIIVSGEIKTKAKINYKKIIKNILEDLDLNPKEFKIKILLNSQSQEINQSVDKKDSQELGAGDQGIKFGYATNETEDFLPLPIVLSHRLLERAEKLRKNKTFKWAKSDMKSQVTIDYSFKNPKIDTIILSIQHEKNYDEKEFKNFILTKIINPVVKKFNLNTNFNYHINPSGSFVLGGPKADTGLTGRKIIVDTYGGKARHGGGAFSGKDYTKVDRSAAYAARWIAKNLVAAKVANEVEIQLSYAIGIARPISISIDTFGTSKYKEKDLLKIIDNAFDLSVSGIINHLNLKNPIYQETSFYGHFGKKSKKLPWEKLNMTKKIIQKIEELKL